MLSLRTREAAPTVQLHTHVTQSAHAYCSVRLNATSNSHLIQCTTMSARSCDFKTSSGLHLLTHAVPCQKRSDHQLYSLARWSTTDYCWRSWTSRIAAPYKSRVDWLIGHMPKHWKISGLDIRRNAACAILQWTSALLTELWHRMLRIVCRHRWSSASVRSISVTLQPVEHYR